MFLELIAVIFAGLSVAGITLVINRSTGNRLPRWIVPVAAGLGMIAATIASEYGWYNRTVAQLPDGFKVAEAVENRSFYRPWTYVASYTERFVAVDGTSLRSNPQQPDQHLVDLYFFGRWSPVTSLAAMMDCADWRRAIVSSDTTFQQDGALQNANWITGQQDDPLLATVCEG